MNNQFTHPKERIRFAILTFFFAQGLCMASWASRIPDFKDVFAANYAFYWGLILFMIPVGKFVAIPLAGYLVSKLGSRSMVQVSILGYASSLLCIGLAHEVYLLGFLLFCFGVCWNLCDISFNTQGIEVERIYGKTIMATFHGGWSLGACAIYGYSDLWTVRKIIRLHGGKINGYRHGKSFAFQIVIPTDCHCRNQECSAIKHSSTNTKNKAKKSSESDKDDTPNAKTKDTSHILLVMADGAFRNYLRKALSRYFQISVLKDPDLLKDTVVRQNPDAIIIDDNVNGTNGDALSFRIKTDKMIGYIPVVLLIRAFDNESYLSHLGSGADRLELRTESICRLRANIRMLVENRMVLRERVKLFLSDAVFPMVPTKEEMETENTDQIFMDKVNKILEKNLSTDKYTIDKLSIDIGMSRTAFYSRIREITGNPPENYIYSFKMDRALKLLASQQYTVSEIAGMLGYCDAKYFGKKFKDFYHVCPTDYIKSIIG